MSVISANNKYLRLLIIYYFLLGLLYGHAHATTTQVATPFQVFQDSSGAPLNAGYIYIGEPGLDPVTNTKTAYWDSALTIPASQPIRTLNGYPVRSGTAAKIYVENTYSITIKDKNGVFITSQLNEGGIEVAPVTKYLSEYASFAAACAALVTTECDLWIDDNSTVSTAVTASSYIHIKPMKGFKLTKATGGSIAFSGSVDDVTFQWLASWTAGDITGLTVARPEWWGGGPGVAATTNDAAFANAIASMTNPYIILQAGEYDHTGITPIDHTHIKGAGRYNTFLNNTSSTSHSIDITGLNSVQIEDLQIVSSGGTTGYAIYGAKPGSETQRYPKILNVMIGEHLGGIYLNNPLDATIDNCYIGGQGKAESGGIGIDLVDGTTVTVSNTYVTGFEHDIETSTQGYVFNRIICETADKGIISTTRGTIISPYFSGIDTYDIDLATNGTQLIGYVGTDTWPTMINFASDAIRQRTTFLPATADLPYQIFGRRIFYGTAAPTTGTWSIGDLYFNTGAITPYGWTCIAAGTPGTWVELSGGLQYAKKMSAVSTSGTGEDDLQTVSIPASTIGASPAYYGGGVRVTAFGRKTGSAGNKTIKLYFGATAITVFPAANNENDWKLEAVILNAGTASSQKVHWTFTDSTAVTSDYTTTAIDTSAAVTLKLTGEVADGADAITCEAWVVERL